MAASVNAQNHDKTSQQNSSPLLVKNHIAYQGFSDLSALPINKDGIGVCEKCGAIGVKHSFYTKSRKFCSVACARGSTGYQSEKMGEDKIEDVKNGGNRKLAGYRFKLMESSEHLVGMVPAEPLPRLPGLWTAAVDDFTQPPIRAQNPPPTSFQWADEQLFRCDFLAAPVKLFLHAPLSDLWDNIFEGMKVEVRNRDCSPKLSDYFWVATVLKLKGYMGLLRYEGFGNDDSKDFWVNLMNWEVHPVGWCATRGKPLIPPQTIENKYNDWKTFLVKQLTGARTLPSDFYTKIAESTKSRFRLGHVLEVVDKNKLSQVKVAFIDNIVEKRLHVRYYDSTPEAVSGFWCHQDSPLIHPVGWARSVGHELDAPMDYIQRLNNHISQVNDTAPDMFKCYLTPDPHNINFYPLFNEGTKIEAIDPLNLSSICQATVMRVLLHGYVMIRIDCYPPDEAGSDWFCYHQNSPYIFPAGFCAERGIPLTVSLGQSPQWAAPLPPPPKGPPPHGFVSGMRLECVDLMEPRLVCVATISRVVGRLLKVHFDGWGEEYDQWLDCESTDIYPVGWCKAVGHRLEGPPVQGTHTKVQPPARRRGRKKKTNKSTSDPPKEMDFSNGNNIDIDNKEDKVTLNMSDSYDISFKKENNHSDHSLEDSNISPNSKSEVNSVCFKKEDIVNQELDNKNFSVDAASVVTVQNENSMQIDTPDDINNQISSEDSTQSGVEVKVEQPQAKCIPRLVGNIFVDPSELNNVQPESWESSDVIEFLSVNDCAPHSVHFSQVTGRVMLDLTKDDIIELLQMKVGPSLKIFDLIQQLKCKLKKTTQPRHKLFK